MKIIIFGNNDTASLAHFYLKHNSSHVPVAFSIDGDYCKESHYENLPIIPFEEITRKNEEEGFFAPIYDNKFRERKAKEIKEKGFPLISYISSKATCWSPVGENCFIMEDNTIQPYVQIGNNIILWSGNHIGHHSIIKDNVFFSSHVVLSGHCVVESYCWLGVNATIKDHIHLAEGTFIAMSSSVTKDTKPYKKYRGMPAEEYGDLTC